MFFGFAWIIGPKEGICERSSRFFSRVETEKAFEPLGRGNYLTRTRFFRGRGCWMAGTDSPRRGCGMGSEAATPRGMDRGGP